MQYFKRIGIWFTNGVALALGIAATTWIITRFDETPHTAPDMPQYPVDSVQLSAVETILFADTLTLTAILISPNKSNVAVEVELIIKNNGQVAYTCPTQSFTYKQASQPQRIQVECRDLKRSNLPESAATELHIRKVTWLPT